MAKLPFRISTQFNVRSMSLDKANQPSWYHLELVFSKQPILIERCLPELNSAHIRFYSPRRPTSCSGGRDLPGRRLPQVLSAYPTGHAALRTTFSSYCYQLPTPLSTLFGLTTASN